MAAKIDMVYAWLRSVEVVHVGHGKNRAGKQYSYVQGMVRDENGRLNLYSLQGEISDDTCAPAELKGRKYDILCRVTCFKDSLYLHIVEAVLVLVNEAGPEPMKLPLKGAVK